MSDTIHLDPFRPANPAFSLAIAEAIGSPLPPDWLEPDAIARRQDALAHAAHTAGIAAVEVAVAYLETKAASGNAAPVSSPEFTAAIGALLDARRAYVRQTERSDALVIIRAGLVSAAGQALAEMVLASMDKLIADIRATVLPAQVA